ncbi:MAG TPA: ATP synthase subunit I [Gammaproteobacteria bacterium]|nr:ATP synthase subunit I [Gammaproteobacteria bacterium]
MSHAAKVMRATVRRVLILQLLIVLGVTTVFLVLQGSYAALSAFYGGLIALFATWLMGWRITKAAETAAQDTSQGAFVIYAGAVQRFLLTLVLMALGMGTLKLAPVAILVCYALAQLAYAFNRVDTQLRT